VRAGGHVVVGEPYFSPGQTTADGTPGRTLKQVVDAFESAGLAVVTLIRSSVDDWDTYSSIKATSLLDWLDSNPGHADADDVQKWRREAVDEIAAVHMGWAVIAGRNA
jgi:hypothetical protein